METSSSINIGPLPVETQLIAKIVSGDLHCFRDLIHPYERRVYQVALRILLNPADAEEVVQEALISAYRNLHRFRGDAKFSTWLIKITINHARGRLRSQRPHVLYSIDETTQTGSGVVAAVEITHTGPSPLDLAEQNELRSLIWKALNRLEPPYRDVFLMHVCEGHSTESTAKALGITIPATKTRLYRARRMLQHQLTKFLSAEQISSRKSNLSRHAAAIRPITATQALRR
jgi:RNA polymerase sigma-70 factor, ECF subfamily